MHSLLNYWINNTIDKQIKLLNGSENLFTAVRASKGQRRKMKRRSNNFGYPWTFTSNGLVEAVNKIETSAGIAVLTTFLRN